MDPADRLLGVEEIHGCGLLGARGQQAVDCGATQGGGLDVLGVGDQQDRQTVYWYWKYDTIDRTNSKQEKQEQNTSTVSGSDSVLLVSVGTHHSWPCKSGCPAGTSSPPHRSRCRSLRC